jgi:ABC-type iron transport system FetAB permease component
LAALLVFPSFDGPILLHQRRRLSLRATWQEALQSVIRNTLTTALTPTINALSVTGIVHIPGMMTGQILAGQSPFQAAAYQVLIFFLIASQACTTVQILMKLTQ